MKTAEFVTPQHPDKICDRIADAILDAYLKEDPFSRVAVEVMGGHGIITVTGEVTSNTRIDIPLAVQSVVGDRYGIQTNISIQSPEISRAVDEGGAGDQGIMIGYACRETPEMMPKEYVLARNLARHLYATWPVDGKVQVTVDNDNKPIKIVASFQGAKTKQLRRQVEKMFTRIDDEILAAYPTDAEIICNPAGEWDIGGFDSDTGCSGRKIVVDSYGPRVPVGGGSFSGKDPTKVDRSAAYMARHLAVQGLRLMGAKEILIELSYAIGREWPLSLEAKTVGGIKLAEWAVDARPETIIKKFNLRRPIYQKTAEWGHFGNGFPWDE